MPATIEKMLEAVRKADAKGTMRPHVRTTPFGDRVQVGTSVDAYLFVARSGRPKMSPGVPLRWRRPIRIALQGLGVEVEMPRDVPRAWRGERP